MSTKLQWIAALSAVTAAFTAALPSAAIEPDQSCFMRTSSGRVVSLGHLCSEQAPRRVNTPRPLRRPSVAVPNQASATASNTYLVKEGKGGYFDNKTKIDYDFYYQIWSDQSNTYFELRVWRYQEYPQGRPFLRERRFRTAVEAEHHFACRYANQPTAVCPLETPKPAQ